MKPIIKNNIRLLLGLGAMALLFNGCSLIDDNPETVTDIDGNVYHVVKIGNQEWLAENLKTTHYRNGDAIPNVTDDPEWEALESGAYCNYDNQSSKGSVYGRLYNWFAVDDSRGIAPEGWHVASDDEWAVLCAFLGGEPVAGGKLKERGLTHWKDPNLDATNSFGFSGLPAGKRSFTGEFEDINLACGFWSSTPGDGATSVYYLNHGAADVYQNFELYRYGRSIRCLRD